MKDDNLYPDATKEISDVRAQAAPEALEAWRVLSKTVFKDGALPGKTKQLIAIAVAHVTQCPYCIRAHTKQAVQAGATEAEIMEAIWVAAEMRAGAAVAHSAIALDEIIKSERS